jgi:hypothetical protein
MHHSALAPATQIASDPAVLPQPGPWPALVGAERAATCGVAFIVESGNPDPATLCANLARCVIEILAGARPLDQIGRWVSDSVYVHLLRRTMLALRARAVSAEDPLRPRMRIGEPRLGFPSEGVVEAVVLVHQPARSRAVAIRLERHRARWRATTINVL